MVNVSIQQALKYVADHPDFDPDDTLITPVWELVGRVLYQMANSPDPKKRGSMSRATRAQKMILNRMVGVRRSGTHPVARSEEEIQFIDLTMGELP